jgi:hypothetical protein
MAHGFHGLLAAARSAPLIDKVACCLASAAPRGAFPANAPLLIEGRVAITPAPVNTRSKLVPPPDLPSNAASRFPVPVVPRPNNPA